MSKQKTKKKLINLFREELSYSLKPSHKTGIGSFFVSTSLIGFTLAFLTRFPSSKFSAGSAMAWNYL